LLTKLRVTRQANKKVGTIAKYHTLKIAAPTMAQINKWKHDARNFNEMRSNLYVINYNIWISLISTKNHQHDR
jgi:UDP-N-acetylglucosamine pyrophosphorylase